MFCHAQPLENTTARCPAPPSRRAFPMKPPAPGILAAKRWPDGFVCPACGHARGWGLKRRRASWECAACGKETFGDRRHDHAPQPLAPEDLVHGRSHRDQPLERYLRPCNSRPSSGSAVTRVPGSCYTSCAVPWSIRIAACLRTWSRSMRPPYRSATVKDPTAGGQGRSPQGKMRIAGAVELSPEGEPRRIRAGADRGFLRAQPSCLRCRDLGARARG